MKAGRGQFVSTALCAGLATLACFADLRQANGQNAPSAVTIEEATINVAATTGKAVVSISAEHTTTLRGGRQFSFNSPFGEDEFFRKFFDDFFGEMPQREYKQMGLGSGFIIDPRGYILTNHHVVADADKITVILPDGRQLRAEIRGQDPRSDLAVIKVNAENLPVARMGNSDDLRIGQWAVAIGNPFGFAMQNPEPTVTSGVISALHRTLGRSFGRDKDYNDLIQTDAAINPGNSGGPLVNLKGEVVGINVAIFSTTGGYQGVGFAIPINSAKRIISKLIEGKEIKYGWLGVTIQDLTPELAGYFGLTETKGALVVNVLPGTPAAKAGLKEGDVILQSGSTPITNVKELYAIVGRVDIGKKITLTVLRDKKETTVDVVIAERPAAPGEEDKTQPVPQKGAAWRGLNVQELTAEMAQKLGLEAAEGVLVVSIEPNSPADASGMTPGDVIVEVNRQKVKTPADYQKITTSVRGDVLVRTQRGYFVVKEKIEKEQ